MLREQTTRSESSKVSRKPRYSRKDIHKYPAKMVGKIAEEILETYSKKGDIVLDPFCGSGTVLLRSRGQGLQSVGVDLNPLACLIANVKCSQYEISRLRETAKRVFLRIERTSSNQMVAFEGIDYWFEKDVQRDLARILSSIAHVRNKSNQDFFKVCLSSIIRSVSNADPHIPPPVFSKRMRKVVQNRKLDTVGIFNARVVRNLEIMERTSVGPKNNHKPLIVCGDVRALPLSDASINLVLTSPPYLDAQKYMRTLNLETQWLGLISQEQVRRIKRRIIGTEVVPSTHVSTIGLSSADTWISRIRRFDKSGLRAAIVYEFLLQMKESIKEISRVMRPSGVFALVTADNTVAGMVIPFHDIFVEMARDSNLFLIEARADKIRYRSFMLNRNRTAGLIKSEWILIFRKRPARNSLGRSPFQT
jgi:DNA modification methylase